MEDCEPQELLMQNVQDIRKRLLDTERNLKKLSKIEKRGNYDEYVLLLISANMLVIQNAKNVRNLLI